MQQLCPLRQRHSAPTWVSPAARSRARPIATPVWLTAQQPRAQAQPLRSLGHPRRDPAPRPRLQPRSACSCSAATTSTSQPAASVQLVQITQPPRPCPAGERHTLHLRHARPLLRHALRPAAQREPPSCHDTSETAAFKPPTCSTRRKVSLTESREPPHSVPDISAAQHPQDRRRPRHHC